jgi:hypothetical protein
MVGSPDGTRVHVTHQGANTRAAGSNRRIEGA